MVEKPACIGAVNFVQVKLSPVTERRMTYVVTYGNGFNQIEIEPQNLAYGAGYPGNQLDVRRATGYIVVFVKRKHLRLVAASVKKRAVDNFIRVHGELRPDEFGIVSGVILPARLRVAAGVRRVKVFRFVGNAAHLLYLVFRISFHKKIP